MEKITLDTLHWFLGLDPKTVATAISRAAEYNNCQPDDVRNALASDLFEYEWDESWGEWLFLDEVWAEFKVENEGVLK